MDPELSLKPTTPRKLSMGIKRFLQAIGLNGKTKFLKFSYISDKFSPQHCLSNCEQENINNGSEVVYGWTIWEDHKKHFVEAEFHAVIKKDGELIDITPRRDGEKK